MLMGNASKILQTVSANIDRDVLEPALLQLADLIMLTDTTGLLTGEEKISVQGVNVAIQRETLRQRQIEFLQATINPTDMKIVGLKGRAAILRNVSTTIGMDGEEIVPPEDVIDKMVAAEQAQQQGPGSVQEQITKGVQQGVEAGIQRITTELVAGQLAPQEGMTEGPPAHVGTPGGGQGQPGQPGQPGQTPGARVGQGQQPGQVTSHAQGPGAMAPTTSLTGPSPGGGAMPVSPGVG
jgi:hypothetical protein